jgi:uncharacterized delta-60 repeat protein
VGALPLSGSRLLLPVTFEEPNVPTGLGTGLAVLGADGSLDPSFGNGGFVQWQAAWGLGATEWADQVAVDRRGRILLVGTTDGRAEVTRFLPDGTPDPSFGAAGTVEVDLGGTWSNGHSVAVEPNGDILVGGNAGFGSCSHSKCEIKPALARLHEDGSVDRSFGKDGHEALHTRLAEEPFEMDVVAAPDGKVLVTSGEQLAMEIHRLLPDGSVDRSFGRRGEIVVHEAGPVPQGITRSFFAQPKIAVTPTGQIVVVGEVQSSLHHGPTRSAMAVLRYRADGRPDPSFGRDGHVVLRFGAYVSAESLVLRREGGIVVAGWTPKLEFDKAHPYFAVASLRADGSLDQNFGQHGLAKVRPGSGGRVSLSLQGDTAIVVGPDNEPGHIGAQTVLARVPLGD